MLEELLLELLGSSASVLAVDDEIPALLISMCKDFSLDSISLTRATNGSVFSIIMG